MMNFIKQEPGIDGPDNYFPPDSNNWMFPAPSYYNQDTPTPQIKIETDEDDTSQSSVGPPVQVTKEPKKRGRPKKIRDESNLDGEGKKTKQDSVSNSMIIKKKRDRFNGMPEEEVLQMLLPDRLCHNLDILIIGINPGLFAAYVGHHYAGPGNHFWKCLYLSGLIPEPMNAYDDIKLMDFGIGFTNIVARTTRGSSDLKKSEIKEGAKILKKKILEYNPKIAVFNGKGIYEVFSGNKNFHIGKQSEKMDGTDTVLFVMPSSSARCAQLPRAIDKVPFYLALKKLRDYLKGDIFTLDESEVVFPNLELKVKIEPKDEAKDEDDDEIAVSPSVASSKELTIEQIQMQAEYQEALFASAEGIDIPHESWSGTPVGSTKYYRDEVTEHDNGPSDYKSPLSYSSDFHLSFQTKIESPCVNYAHGMTEVGPCNLNTTIKKETSFNTCEYAGVSVDGPVAQQVLLDPSNPDPYQCHISTTPQYTSLGDLPSKAKKYTKSSNPTCSTKTVGKNLHLQESHSGIHGRVNIPSPQQHSYHSAMQYPLSH